MAHHKPTDDSQITVCCYKCSEGCVHLAYASLILTFTPEQFLHFAEVIAETRRQLLLEREQETSLTASGAASQFVM